MRTVATLYAGPDHLLSIFNAAYSEDYRRFYYRDIQAIAICETKDRAKWGAIYGGIVVILLLIAFLAGGAWAIFLMLLAAVFLIVFLRNWLKGPTCACRVFTAASQTDLPSLGRLRNALKALEIIKPLIEQSQGTISSEEIRTKMGRETENT
jgi:hypothetical protein